MTTTTRDDLTYTVEQIARKLDGWHARRDDDKGYGVELVHDTGARVWITTPTYGDQRGKIHATITAPFDQFTGWAKSDQESVNASYKERDIYCDVDRRKYPRPEIDRYRIGINMNPARGVDVMAKDLTRRLLGHAIAYHAEAMAALAEHRAQLDKQAATLTYIISSVQGARRWGTDSFSGENYRGQVTTDGRVYFERLSMSADQAIVMLNALDLDAS